MHNQYRVIRKDGMTRWLEAFVSHVEYNGRPALLSGTLDITERQQAEEELRKLSSAVEQTADTILITNRDGVIEYVNPAFEQLTGYS